jgi:cytochrome c oxidase assembly factor CtaG
LDAFVEKSPRENYAICPIVIWVGSDQDLPRAAKRTNDSMILFAATLLLVCMEASAYAHVADGDNVLTDWHWRLDVGSILLLFGTLYLRGWTRLRKKGGDAKCFHLLFYTLALGFIACALLSPLDDLASYLLVAHMAQHELLMMLAPPLILLAKPAPILLWGLPRFPRTEAGHLLTRPFWLRRALDFVTRMPVAWCVYVVNLWAWHHPVLYEAALKTEWIHDLEHIMFFLAGLIFWWPVLRPASRPAPIEDGRRILYLFLAATQDTALAGLIGLWPVILYPHYEASIRIWGLTPLQDQVGGGLVMFAAGNLTYLVAILCVINALLSERTKDRPARRVLGLVIHIQRKKNDSLSIEK